MGVHAVVGHAGEARTTDFGVIHNGPEARGDAPSVVLREIVDDSIRMYPVWWEDDRFYRYLEAATAVPNLLPLGRLGLYKYVTMDDVRDGEARLVDRLEAPRGKR